MTICSVFTNFKSVCACVRVSVSVCGGREEKADVTLVTDAYGECV